MQLHEVLSEIWAAAMPEKAKVRLCEHCVGRTLSCKVDQRSGTGPGSDWTGGTPPEEQCTGRSLSCRVNQSNEYEKVLDLIGRAAGSQLPTVTAAKDYLRQRGQEGKLLASRLSRMSKARPDQWLYTDIQSCLQNQWGSEDKADTEHSATLDEQRHHENDAGRELKEQYEQSSEDTKIVDEQYNNQSQTDINNQAGIEDNANVDAGDDERIHKNIAGIENNEGFEIKADIGDNAGGAKQRVSEAAGVHVQAADMPASLPAPLSGNQEDTEHSAVSGYGTKHGRWEEPDSMEIAETNQQRKKNKRTQAEEAG